MTDDDETETRDVAYRLGSAMLNYAHAALAAGHAVSVQYDMQDAADRPCHFVLTCTTTPPDKT